MSLRVTNKGRRAGKHTVLLFANKGLVAYRKVWLEAGDRRTVSLRFTGKEGTRVRVR